MYCLTAKYFIRRSHCNILQHPPQKPTECKFVKNINALSCVSVCVYMHGQALSCVHVCTAVIAWKPGYFCSHSVKREPSNN
uniref:Uncharacterized protein n=1 Tax=Octopus bimaculoides TaxID=37653 RepID=A0A0L8HPR8_OCTBM